MESDVAADLAREMVPSDLDVEVRVARLDRAAEQELFDTIWDVIDTVTGLEQVSWTWSAVDDRIGVTLYTEDRVDTEPLRLALAPLADQIDVTIAAPNEYVEACSGSPNKTGGKTEAGRLLTFCQGNPCTSGFGVRSQPNPNRTGILTAAHCHGAYYNSTSDWGYVMFANSTDPYSSFRHAGTMDPGIADAEWKREWFGSALPSSEVYLWGQNWLQVTGSSGSNPEGMTVCAKGGRTARDYGHQNGYMCGEVVDNVVGRLNNGVSGEPYAVAAVDYTTGPADDFTLIDGDSGAPIFRPNGIAQGTHVGGGNNFEQYAKIEWILDDLSLFLLAD